MPILIFLVLIVLLLVGLMFYSLSYLPSWFASDGAIVQNLIAGLITMLLEISAVSLIIAQFADRKWQKSRAKIYETILKDAKFIASLVVHLVDVGTSSTDAMRAETEQLWETLSQHIIQNEARETLQYLTPAFTPDISEYAIFWMSERRKVERRTRDMLSTERLLGGDLYQKQILLLQEILLSIVRGEYPQVDDENLSYVPARFILSLSYFLLGSIDLDVSDAGVKRLLTALDTGLPSLRRFVRDMEKKGNTPSG